MKRIVFGLSALASVVIVSAVQANTIQAWQTPGRSYSDGGEFTARLNGNPATDFQTFCIEVFNTFSPGATYTYTTGQTTHNNPPGASPLTMGTAWLVRQWWDGSLAYDGTKQDDVGALQAALWYFQSQPYNNASQNFSAWGMPTSSSGSWDTSLNKYIQAADTALGSDAAGFAASAGAYGVFVYQVENGQDFVGVPDGGTTVALLGIGLTSLGFLSRRYRK